MRRLHLGLSAFLGSFLFSVYYFSIGLLTGWLFRSGSSEGLLLLERRRGKGSKPSFSQEELAEFAVRLAKYTPASQLEAQLPALRWRAFRLAFAGAVAAFEVGFSFSVGSGFLQIGYFPRARFR